MKFTKKRTLSKTANVEKVVNSSSEQGLEEANIAQSLLNMTQKNLKNVDKDTILTLINQLKQFL